MDKQTVVYSKNGMLVSDLKKKKKRILIHGKHGADTSYTHCVEQRSHAQNSTCWIIYMKFKNRQN